MGARTYFDKLEKQTSRECVRKQANSTHLTFGSSTANIFLARKQPSKRPAAERKQTGRAINTSGTSAMHFIFLMVSISHSEREIGVASASGSCLFSREHKFFTLRLAFGFQPRTPHTRFIYYFMVMFV